MTADTSYVLAIVAAAAFFTPLVADRTGLPTAVLELLVGLALGLILPSRYQDPGSFIGVLGSLGFLILMFLVGLEIDLPSVWSGSKTSLLAGALLSATSLAFSWLVLGRVAGASALWVLSGGAVSVGVAAPVLHSFGMSKTKISHDVIVMGTTAEIIYILALDVYSASINHSLHALVFVAALRTFGIIACALIAAFVVRRARRQMPRHFTRWFRRDDPTELGLRGAFGMLFVLVAAASFLRIQTVFAAIIAGVLFRNVIGNAKALTERLTSVANSFFIPVFFVTVGIETKLRLGLINLLPRVGLVVVVLVAPRLASLGYFAARRHPFRSALAADLLLMAPLTMLVATAQLGRASGVLSSLNASAIVLTATITALAFPALARRLLINPGGPADP